MRRSDLPQRPAPGCVCAWSASCECVRRSARRGRWYPQGAHAVAVSASLRLRCGARLGVAPLNSLRSLRSLRSNRRGESVLDARCARRLQGCAPRRHRNRPLRVPPAALPRLWSSLRTPPAFGSASETHPDSLGGAQINMSWSFVAENRTVAARQAAPGGGDFWGDEQRRPGVGARQRASKTDSPRLFERSERSERSEFSGATPG